MTEGEKTETENSHITLFAELKPQLSVVHAVLDISRDRYESGATINVLKSHIAIEEGLEDKVCRVTLANMSLIPASCHGLQWVPGDGMHFRMQVCNQSDGPEVLKPVQSCLPPGGSEAKLAPFKTPNFCCNCKICGQPILQNKQFRRVLPLPSVDWHEFADQMYCHPHKDDVPNGQLLTPSPALHDCFVGDGYFLVHNEGMNTALMKKGKTGSLLCHRCSSVIGRQTELGQSPCVQLSCHALDMSTEESLKFYETIPEHLSRERCLENWLARYLVEETTEHSSSRLVVEAQPASKKTSPYLLLWVLESNVVLYSGSCTKKEEGETDLHLEPEPILKVLYKDCIRSKHKGVGKQWREDFTVHSVTLPLDFCHQVLYLLIERTKSLPRSLQTANGFYVGYLRKKTKTR